MTRQRASIVATLALVCAFVLSGCGDDGYTPLYDGDVNVCQRSLEAPYGTCVCIMDEHRKEFADDPNPNADDADHTQRLHDLIDRCVAEYGLN